MISNLTQKAFAVSLIITGFSAGFGFSVQAQMQAGELPKSWAANQVKADLAIHAAPLKLAATTSKPGNSQDFIFQNNNWVLDVHSAYTYNTAGQLTSRVKTNPVTGQNISREVFTYDAQGNQTEMLNQNWVSGAWVMASGTKSAYTFDSNNRITQKIDQSWSNNTWTNQERKTYLYTANGELTEQTTYNWMNNAWNPLSKYVHTYTNGVITRISTQNVINNLWTDTYQEINIVWHNQAKMQYASLVSQIMDNGVWADFHKTTYTHDPNGGFVAIAEFKSNGSWINGYRRFKIHDTRKNFIGEKMEMWDATAAAWILYAAERANLTYNATDDITEWVLESYSNNTNTYAGVYKEIYSNFQYFTITGKPEADTPLKAEVYPNPATSFISIQLPESNTRNVTARLTDVTGKNIFSQKLTAAEPIHQINIEKLPVGLYLLQLQTESGFKTVKIIKE